MMFVYLTCNFWKCSVSGDNKSFGMPANPVALDRIPGGSSSGSAVAVAAGFVDFALGEDWGYLNTLQKLKMHMTAKILVVVWFRL